ncbi:MAG: sensor histidine kinase [Bdellovibrionales bacterium]
MRAEWQSYWRETFKSARSVVLALGVSLVLWVFRLPEISKDEYLFDLGISCIYGLTIFAYIWGLYALAYAVTTYLHVKSGRLVQFGWGVHVPLGFFGMAAGLITARWFKALLLQRSFSMSGMLESLMIGSFISLMFMFYYAYKHSAEENLELKAAKAESELHVLKNQMQPHFLFNSLNSLSELIETNKDCATEMAMKLSDLYREILDNSKRQMVSLSSEVSIIKKYLELEKIRFGARLNFSINVPENADQIWLPPLVIQTLVENAVKHGVAPAVEGGVVHISVRPNGRQGYHLHVSNTGAISSRSAGSQTGLSNTKGRLDLLYGTKHGFSLRNTTSGVEAAFWFSGDAGRV